MSVAQNMSLAVELVDAVHRNDWVDAQCAIDRADITALALILAAMVDDDRPTKSILHDLPRMYRKVHGPRTRKDRPLMPCGTHAAFTRHKNRGEDPCEACWTAEREYQRTRKRDRRKAEQLGGGSLLAEQARRAS